MTIYQSIYVSKADPSVDQNEIDRILAQPRRNNRKSDITGILIHRAETFMQLLEGEESKVKELLATIERDPRHFDLRTLIRANSERRFFADWSMAYVPPNDLDADLPEVLQFLNSAAKFAINNPSVILPILEKFGRNLPLAKTS